MVSTVCLLLGHVFLLAVPVELQFRDADCLIPDGSVGYCTSADLCSDSHSGVEPVLCRYHRGFGTRICCSRPLSSNQYTQSQRDFFTDSQPINFPSESSYNERDPYFHPTTYQKPYYSSGSGYQPSYDSRPFTNPVRDYEKPSFSSSYGDERPIYTNKPFYNEDDRPVYSTNPSYSTHNRPYTPSRPSYMDQERPIHGYSGRPSFGNQDRPNYPSNPYHGEQDRPNYSSNPYHGEQDRPNYPSNPYNGGQDRPNYPSNPYNGGQDRPNYPSNPFNGEKDRPNYPSNSYHGQQDRPNYSNKPSYADQGRPTYPNDFQTTPSQSFGNQQRPDNDRPWGGSTSGSSSEFGRRTSPRPIWEVESDKAPSSQKRISERKCEEYSKPVSDTIGVLPLSVDADVVPLNIQKCEYSAVKLIVGGAAAEPGEFPHMAALGFQSAGSNGILWNCGGSLISERYVMTAGHCVNTSFGNPVVVRLGEHNLERDDDGAEPADYDVQRVIPHPSYSKNLKYNDIALIRLSRNVRIGKYIRPACLPADDNIRGKPVASGWGRTDYVGKLSDTLMKVSLNVVDNRQCNSFYNTNGPSGSTFPRGIVDTMMCAGVLQGGKDTCLGDSGGPLTVSRKDNPCVHYVIGITSFGKVCGAPNSPGVYTKVSKYLSWIERTVWP